LPYGPFSFCPDNDKTLGRFFVQASLLDTSFPRLDVVANGRQMPALLTGPRGRPRPDQPDPALPAAPSAYQSVAWPGPLCPLAFLRPPECPLRSDRASGCG